MDKIIKVSVGVTEIKTHLNQTELLRGDKYAESINIRV